MIPLHTHRDFSRKVIDLSKKSAKLGRFPAGAIIVKDNKIISQSTSGLYPAINHHAESITIDNAVHILNSQLDNCILFTSMEPCLMCLGKAYWSGINKIYFILDRKSVEPDAYEGSHQSEVILSKFNRKVTLEQLMYHKSDAFKIYLDWKK